MAPDRPLSRGGVAQDTGQAHFEKLQPVRDPRYPRFATVDGEHVSSIIAHASGPGTGLGVHVLAHMTEFEAIRTDARRTFAAFVALALVLFLLVCGSARYLRRIQAHRGSCAR
jgi:hypothetical protein